jgi:hypothetical protein
MQDLLEMARFSFSRNFVMLGLFAKPNVSHDMIMNYYTPYYDQGTKDYNVMFNLNQNSYWGSSFNLVYGILPCFRFQVAGIALQNPSILSL